MVTLMSISFIKRCRDISVEPLYQWPTLVTFFPAKSKN